MQKNDNKPAESPDKLKEELLKGLKDKDTFISWPDLYHAAEEYYSRHNAVIATVYSLPHSDITVIIKTNENEEDIKFDVMMFDVSIAMYKEKLINELKKKSIKSLRHLWKSAKKIYQNGSIFMDIGNRCINVDLILSNKPLTKFSVFLEEVKN